MEKGNIFIWSAMLICLLGMCTSSAYSQTCVVGDTTAGAWQVVCTGTDCNCGGGGNGYSIGTGVFEEIAGDQKIVESVGCQVASSGFYCGLPGGAGHDACCAVYQSIGLATKWPPCLKNAEDYINNTSTGRNICNPEDCAIFRNSHLMCGTCDGYGGVYNPVGTNAQFPFKKAVISRTIAQWVCKSCTDVNDNKFQAKVTECGGAQNILNWDNATCTGTCRPCVTEYAAKITECNGEKNITNWDNAQCTGICSPQNQGPPCEIQ